VRIVTSHWFWSDLSISVSEVDVSHVFGIVKEIRIQSIVEPPVVKIILTFPMSLCHPPALSSQTPGYIGIHDWSAQIEPRPYRTHQFVIRVVGEFLVMIKVWESVVESMDTVEHKGV
jgi:hypothetical protein